MKKSIYLLAVAAMAITSCDSGSDFDGFTKTENGLHYKFYKQNESAPKAQLGNGIVFTFKIATQKNDSVLYDSKTQSPNGSGEVQFMLEKSTFVGSLEEGMMMMAKGDSASFIVPADSFFLKTQKMNELPKGIASGSFIKATIVMKDILDKKQVEEKQKQMQEEYAAKMQAAQAEEMVKLEKYLADNKITTKPDSSGIIFIESKKGNGQHPKVTDEVKVHYTGTLLDGTKFDSSVDRGEPASFPLTQVIPGWTKGIQYMSKGSKAKLIIPSSMGYGAQNQGPIPPFSTLVFEVELIDFKPAPDMGQMQMPQGHSAGDGHNH